MERPKEGVRATCVADSSVSWDGAPLPDFPTGRPRVTVVHYGENRGEEPVELVMVYAGSDGLPLSEPAE